MFRMRGMLSRSIPLVVGLSVNCLTSAWGQPELSFESQSRQEFRIPQGLHTALKRSNDGSLLVLMPDEWAIYRVPLASEARKISLMSIPERAGQLWLLQDLVEDSAGRLYVPGIWRPAPKQTFSGVFVTSPSGNYERTIAFSPSVEVRRIAVDQNGDLYALAGC